MFFKIKKTASVMAVLVGCICLCACENTTAHNKQTDSQTISSSYNSNQNYIASQTENVDIDEVPVVTTSLSEGTLTNKNTTTAVDNSSDKKTSTTTVKDNQDTTVTTTTRPEQSLVTTSKNTLNSSASVTSTTSNTVSSVTTSQSTTQADEDRPVFVYGNDITESVNAQLLISQLSQRDLAVFEKINDAVNSFTEEVVFENGEVTQQQVEDALLMVSLTNLEDNYVSNQYVISVDNLGNVSKLTLTFTKEPEQQLYELNELYKVVEEIIEGCDAHNDYDAVKYFHDEIVKRCRYDGEGENMLSAYGCLVDGEAVCEGYAKAFVLICSYYGIECMPVTGDTTSGEGIVEPHMWNLVKLDGKWYHLDLTWNDPVTDIGDDFIKYDYFAVSDDVISIDHDITQIGKIEYPVADDSHNDYFTHYGLVYDEVDSAVIGIEALISGAVSKNERFVSIKFKSEKQYNQFIKEVFETKETYISNNQLKAVKLFNILARVSNRNENDDFNPSRYGKIFDADRYIVTVVLYYE